jgi:hypothetical protein
MSAMGVDYHPSFQQIAFGVRTEMDLFCIGAEMAGDSRGQGSHHLRQLGLEGNWGAQASVPKRDIRIPQADRFFDHVG